MEQAIVETIRPNIQILLSALRPKATLKQEVSEYINRTIITSFPQLHMDGWILAGRVDGPGPACINNNTCSRPIHSVPAQCTSQNINIPCASCSFEREPFSGGS